MRDDTHRSSVSLAVAPRQLDSVPAGAMVTVEGLYQQGHPELANFEGVMITVPRGMPNNSRLRVTGFYWPGKDASDPRTHLAVGYNGASIDVVEIVPLSGGFSRTDLFAGEDVSLVWVEPAGQLELVMYRWGDNSGKRIESYCVVLPVAELTGVAVVPVPSILDSVSSLRLVGPFQSGELVVTTMPSTDAREVARLLRERFGVPAL